MDQESAHSFQHFSAAAEVSELDFSLDALRSDRFFSLSRRIAVVLFFSRSFLRSNVVLRAVSFLSLWRYNRLLKNSLLAQGRKILSKFSEFRLPQFYPFL